MAGEPVPFDISEDLIREYASPESFRRGEDYYRQGAVQALIRRGNILHAEVAGSDLAPYDVRVSFDRAAVMYAGCSCPYEWGGWCKHIVAALLAQVHEPEIVRDLPTLEETLSTLERDQLRDLLLRLVERDPSLTGVIEGEVTLSATSGTPKVNTEAIRRRIRSSIYPPGYRPYDDYHQHTGGDLDEARRILDGAWGSIRADDSRSALPILEAITEEYMESWEMLDWEMIGDYGGELIDFFGEVGAAWTEALLSVDDLTPHEKEDWSARLDVWWGELGDYDTGEYFGAAFKAVEQGWSYPPLVRILAGEVPVDDFFEEIYDDPLTIARLNVLERRGRYEEYLRLSEAAGETTSHAAMLARLGRAQEAVEYSLKHLVAPEEALAVAEALREQGELEAALQVGEHGLSLEGPKSRLASWVRDLATGTGRPELALEAAVVALRADPDLASYRRVRELAGKRWPEHREQLLDHLRQRVPYYPAGEVDIFLHENLIQDAIAAVEESPVETLVARVADAAIESHPEWVIDTCRKRAEEIMDESRSKHYAEAVTWLAKARDAYLADGRAEEWQVYLEELIDRHQRKYKLRPMLENLGRQ
jgi:uncharacterized Zn finger protein